MCFFHDDAAAGARRAAQQAGRDTQQARAAGAPSRAQRRRLGGDLDTLAGVRIQLASVTGRLLAGSLDVRKAGAALAGLRELARLLERAEGTGHSLPAGARPATAEEERYLEAHGQPPAGIILGVYALPVADAPAASPSEEGDVEQGDDQGGEDETVTDAPGAA